MSQKLEIVLSDRCFKALTSYCETNSQLPSSLIEELLSQKLIDAEPNQNQLQALENRLIQLIYQTINSQLDLRVGETAKYQPKSESESAQAIAVTEYSREIHQLQIGDLVQIKDTDSNYFNQVMQISKVGMIRATVITPTGEESFLKRDLRFQYP